MHLLATVETTCVISVVPETFVIVILWLHCGTVVRADLKPHLISLYFLVSSTVESKCVLSLSLNFYKSDLSRFVFMFNCISKNLNLFCFDMFAAKKVKFCTTAEVTQNISPYI